MSAGPPRRNGRPPLGRLRKRRYAVAGEQAGVSIDVGLNGINAFPQNCQVNLRYAARFISVVRSQNNLPPSGWRGSSRFVLPGSSPETP